MLKIGKNKKGQLSLFQIDRFFINVMSIIIAGILLAVLSPVIQNGIQSSFDSNPDILTRIGLFLLLPFMWVIYIVGSALILRYGGAS